METKGNSDLDRYFHFQQTSYCVVCGVQMIPLANRWWRRDQVRPAPRGQGSGSGSRCRRPMWLAGYLRRRESRSLSFHLSSSTLGESCASWPRSFSILVSTLHPPISEPSVSTGQEPKSPSRINVCFWVSTRATPTPWSSQIARTTFTSVASDLQRARKWGVARALSRLGQIADPFFRSPCP